MVSLAVAVVICLVASALDLSITSFFVAHSNGFKVVLGYNFYSSLVDFAILAVVRVSLHFGCLLGVCFNRREGPKSLQWGKMIFACVSMVLAVFSFVKLLAIAELQLKASAIPYSFWVLFSSNLLFSLLSAPLILLVYAKVKTPAILQVNGDLAEDIESPSDETPILQHSDSTSVKDSDAERKAKEKEELDKLDRQQKVSILLRLLKYCAYEWVWYSLGFAFLIVYSVARTFIPYFMGQVISNIVVTKSYENLIRSVLIMGLLSLASAICAGVRGGSFTWATAKVNNNIRTQLFRSLLAQEIGFFDTTKTGEIMSRITADTKAMGDTVALNVNVFLRNLVMLFGSLAFMFKLSWRLTTLNFIALPIIAVISKLYGDYYEKMSQKYQDSLAKANEVADEVISTMRTVRSFANEKNESDRYEKKLEWTLGVNRKQCIAYIGYTWTGELFDMILMVSVLWYGGHLVLSNTMSSEELIGYLLYQIQLGENLTSMGYVFTGLMEAVGASHKVFKLIDRQPEFSCNGSFTPTGTLKPTVEFRNVQFAYPSRKDTQVLKGVSFTVSPGEVVALVGPSGGGKSSCISLIEHFYEAQAGEVLIGGVRIQDFDHKYIHRKIALVGQEPILYARSIKENIAYGLDEGEFTDETVVEASKAANAHPFIVEMTGGYKTETGEKGTQLSGGQKQRVAIARALIRSPAVLLLDEATSALDAESEYLVQQAIYKNFTGHTVILIAHRLSTVEKADRIVVIEGGQVVQQGSHIELLGQAGLYRNLVQRQLLGAEAEKSTRPHDILPTDTVEIAKSPHIQISDKLVGSLSSTPPHAV